MSYLELGPTLSNLSVRENASALRIVFGETRAIAVRIVQRGKAPVGEAGTEVIALQERLAHLVYVSCPASAI